MDWQQAIAICVRIVSVGSRAVSTLVQTIILFLLLAAAYRLTLHPLAKIPGPKLAAVSGVWYAYHARNGLVARLGRRLHKQYGPVVRVAPNEVWFSSKESFESIYGTGSKGLEKSDFYLALSLTKPEIDIKLQPKFPDTLDLLSDRNMKRYRLQRRLIGPVYRKESVIKFEEAVDKVLETAVKTIRSLGSEPIDLKQWMHIITVECLGASVLSWSPGMLQAGTDWNSSKHSYLGWRRKSVFGIFPGITIFEMYSKSAGRIFASLWNVTFQLPPGFKTFFPDVSKKVNRRTKSAAKQSASSHHQVDLMTDLIQLHRDKPDFSNIYLKKMAITNFGAGHETMASTLTSVFAMLGSHHAVQEEARTEIYETSKSTSFAQAIQLQYTRAATKEAMRLYPVIAMSLPREVPDTGLSLHGYYLPSGTTVGCNPVALHRNEEVCGSLPDEFNPLRWLDDEEQARMLDKYNLNWGGGSRSCPGRALAELIVVKTVTTLLRNFHIEVDKVTEDVVPSYFLSMLTGVNARFIPLQGPNPQDVRH